MRLTALCRDCLRGQPVDVAGAAWVCRKCGVERPLKASASIRERNLVDVCAVCECGYFYVEKDFNGYLGGAILLAAIVGSGLLWATNVFAAIGLLVGATFLDAIFWFVVGERTICYRCLAVYRGCAKNPRHGPYELGTAGRFTDDYEEEKARHE